MKKFLATLACCIVVALAVMGASGTATIPIGGDRATASVTLAYANSDADTVLWTRDQEVSAIGLSVHFADSVNITIAKVWRIYNGVYSTLDVGDTLTAFTAYTSTAGTGAHTSIGAVVSLTSATGGAAQSLPEMFAFIFTYAVSDNGVTTPTATYMIQKQYSK